MIPTAIALAPNGGRRGKADHPALPVTADELARVAAAGLEAGAAMIHVHVRDREGRHLLDAGAYADATAAIRAAVGQRLIVQITSEAVGRYTPAQQAAVVRETRPEAVSLALRELAPDEAHEADFAGLLDWLAAHGGTPQIILYTPEEAARLAALQRRGVVADSLPVLYVLGRYAADQTSDPAELLPFLAQPRFRHWSLCAFGPREAGCVTAAGLLGGHARVGFENNLWLPDGSLAADNAALIGAAAHALTAAGLRLADADQMRDAMAA